MWAELDTSLRLAEVRGAFVVLYATDKSCKIGRKGQGRNVLFSAVVLYNFPIHSRSTAENNLEKEDELTGKQAGGPNNKEELLSGVKAGKNSDQTHFRKQSPVLVLQGD